MDITIGDLIGNIVNDYPTTVDIGTDHLEDVTDLHFDPRTEKDGRWRTGPVGDPPETLSRDLCDAYALFARAAATLLALHAVAAIGTVFVGTSNGGGAGTFHDHRRAGGQELRPQNARHDETKKVKRSTGTVIGKRFNVGADRVAVAALIIAGRRHRRARRHGSVRAMVLGPPWAPWRSEAEAAAWEYSWARKQGEVGQAYHQGPWTLASGGVEDGEDCKNLAPCARSVSTHAIGTRTAPSAGNADRDRPRSKYKRPAICRIAQIIVFAMTVFPLADCRIGEAANPGPQEEADGGGAAKEVTARWVTEDRDAGAVVYSRPHKDGFRDIASPGFGEEERDRTDRGAEQDYQLVVETANTTGWGPLKRRLQTTSADLLLAQETWVLPSYKKEASDWAVRNGWESVWAPAHTGPGGGASGGVAAFARRGLGLRLPTVGPHIVEEARAVAAVVEPPGYRPLLTISTYLIDGKKMQPANRAILSKVGKCAEAQGEGSLVIVGGDYQCQPGDVDRTGFPSMISGKTVTAPSARGTFRTSKAASTIDFFVMSDELVDIIDKVILVEGSGLKSHTPVQVRFRPRATAQKTLAVRQPPALPVDGVYGPVPPPQQWDKVQQAAEEALAEARRSGSGGRTQTLIDAAYAEWCQLAEREVADATGVEPAKWGLRGQLPKMRWRSVLPERSSKKGQPLAAIATWLRGVAEELNRIISVVDDSMGGALFIDNPAERSYMPHGVTFAAPVRGGYNGSARNNGPASGRGGRPRPPTDAAGMAQAVSEIRNDLGDDDGRIVDDASIVSIWGRLVHAATRAKEALQQHNQGGAHADLSLRADIADIVVDSARLEKALESARDVAARKKLGRLARRGLEQRSQESPQGYKKSE